jgi:hypothetical protein
MTKGTILDIRDGATEEALALIRSAHAFFIAPYGLYSTAIAKWEPHVLGDDIRALVVRADCSHVGPKPRFSILLDGCRSPGGKPLCDLQVGDIARVTWFAVGFTIEATSNIKTMRV